MPLRSDNEVDLIKEYHFHLYWLTQSKDARTNAQELLDYIQKKNDEGFFVAKPLRVNEGPVGPHPMSSCEVWVPIEYFAKFYGWIAQVRPANVTVMIHPLSREERLDHTHRIAFMGPSAPLAVEDWPEEKSDAFPAQYPELGLGYSKKTDDIEVLSTSGNGYKFKDVELPSSRFGAGSGLGLVLAYGERKLEVSSSVLAVMVGFALLVQILMVLYR
ncbi:hypothetical protein BCR33DRAFT_768100 [Rhizoclosmatium globosum]|uniref:Dopa 4,5-dioxygenase n=1 Tax=Rhizoclosmatium globosum TaxID=329046 RepID=A0A1Y2C2J2_9FUNG|nr:hypothetical protein BCR33DRAFT_768100 [Rhizoclosmatium globosum]|eukprot:ORY40535.1 hypothetical protein BCR33DRAFT_768100 [Rhizoclosmatium globosum]